MGVYDSLLATTQHGYDTINQNAMARAQMPTFADKFLAGLRSGQQLGMQQQMQNAQMQHLGAQNQNYKDQRINQEMAAAGKYATPDNAGQFSQRIQDLGGPQIDFSAGGSEHQKRQLQTKIASDKNQLASDMADAKKALNQAMIEKNQAMIPLYQAQIRNLESKSDFLDSKADILTGGDNPLMAQLAQSQIFRNYNPPAANPGAAPVINATTRLNETARKNATTDLNKGWMFASPEQRMKLLVDNGSDPGEAKILATQPMAPLGNASIQKVLQSGIEHHRQILQASPTGADTSTETE